MNESPGHLGGGFTRPKGPQKVVKSKGNPQLFPGKSRLVKYFNLARNICYFHPDPWGNDPI